MRKKDELKIDVLSGIDDKFIDKVSAKRYSLLNRKKMPKWIIPSAAAAILVAIMIPVLLTLLVKQVPIYEGMTVLENYNGTSSVSIEPERRGNGFEFLSDKKDNSGNNGNNGDNGNHNGHNKKPVDEIIEEDTSISLEIPEQKMYYANPGQDIYINVHISNPDSFEILSFTLNGKKYSSYMFEDGSDMENLILKVNVGDAKGVIEYTIDAIKYVDGTEIKDVIMEGDRTIKVGVYSAGIQPKISASNEFIGINEVSLEVDLSDKFELIERCGGKAYAFICDDEKLLGSKTVDLGYNKIEFKNLKTNTTYTYGVFAYYDALDGKGMEKHILFEKEFTTKTVVAVKDPEIAQESISFNVVFNELFKSKKLSAMTLYLGEAKVAEVNVSGDITKKTFTLTKLLSNNEYRLVLKYENLGKTETVEYTFKTLEKATPDFKLTETEKTQTSFNFDVAITDVDSVGAITKIELVHGEDVTNVENLATRELTDLLSNNDYTVKVTYTYDLNDGVGNQTLVKELKVKTEAKATPDFKLTETEKTQTSFKFDITVTDVDSIGAISKIELVHGEDVTNVEDLATRELTGLLSNNDYTVKVTYTYDLNDGVGKQTLVKELTVRTEAKATPDFTITETEKTQTSFKFDISVTDIEKVGAITKIELVHGDDVTNIENLATRELAGLLSNNDYTVRATYTYDLNDGIGNQTLVKELKVKTEAKATPDFTMTETEKTQTSFKFDISVTDIDKVGAITKIELIRGKDVTNVENLETREFADLLSNNDYTVRATYTYDLNDGVGDQTIVKEITVKTESKAEPTFAFNDINAGMYDVSGTYDQTNIDNTLISYSVSLYKGGELVKENTDKKVEFNSLDYYTDYTVKIIYTFDVNDGKGVQTKIEEHTVKTKPYIDITSVAVMNQKDAYLDGDSASIRINLDNPLRTNITSVVIGGIEYQTNDTSTSQILIVNIDDMGKLGSGVVERLICEIDGNLYDINNISSHKIEALVIGTLEIISWEIVNENFESINFATPDEQVYLLIHLKNLKHNTVTSLDLLHCDEVQGEQQGIRPNSSYSANEIHILDDDSIYVEFQDTFVNDGIVQTYNLKTNATISSISATYKNDYIERAETSNSEYKMDFFVSLRSKEVRTISSIEEFMNMEDEYHYELTCDLDFSSVNNWEMRPFRGVLDGKGHSISNVLILAGDGKYAFHPREQCAGLFSELYGIIENINFKHITYLEESLDSSIYAAGIIGYAERNSIIRNCTLDENSEFTSSRATYLGGICGASDGVIVDCKNYGVIKGSNTLSANADMGGICGQSYGTIRNCVNYGEVQALKTSSSSGIVGSGRNTVTNCDNYGRIYVGSGYAHFPGVCGIGGYININCNNYGDLIANSSQDIAICTFDENDINCHDYGAWYIDDGKTLIKEATNPSAE